MNNGVSSENNDIYYVYQSFYKLDMNYILIPLTNYNDVICKIIGTQPLCYCKNLKIINCETEECDLAFEYSEVQADIKGNIISIKNPKSGVIKVDSVNEIINKDSIYVNSSHKMCIVNTNLVVSSYSNCIESIEDTDKKFFLGVQWHPEKMVEYDKLEYKIFNYFKKVCENYENR